MHRWIVLTAAIALFLNACIKDKITEEAVEQAHPLTEVIQVHMIDSFVNTDSLVAWFYNSQNESQIKILLTVDYVSDWSGEDSRLIRGNAYFVTINGADTIDSEYDIVYYPADDDGTPPNYMELNIHDMDEYVKYEEHTIYLQGPTTFEYTPEYKCTAMWGPAYVEEAYDTVYGAIDSTYIQVFYSE